MISGQPYIITVNLANLLESNPTWWDNFSNSLPLSTSHSALPWRSNIDIELKKYNARLLDNRSGGYSMYSPMVIQFDTDQDRTYFLLKWS